MAARSAATTLSSRAYLKLVLHAAKYQTRACMGLLIGHTDDSASSSSSRGAGPVRVTDVLPLFHTAPLAPMIELALAQAEHIVRNSGQYAADACIAGLYYAPEHFDARQTNSSSGESTLPMPHAAVVVKMAEKIAANAGGAAGSRIILLDNVRLGALGAANSESTHSGLESFESRSGKWTSSGSVVVVEDGSASGAAAAAAGAEDALDGAVRTLRVLMQQEQQRMLCDFDDHLDDAKADWTNKELEAKVLPTK